LVFWILHILGSGEKHSQSTWYQDAVTAIPDIGEFIATTIVAIASKVLRISGWDTEFSTMGYFCKKKKHPSDSSPVRPWQQR
jgi:hypothetical protein